jgi:hypothetical protein
MSTGRYRCFITRSYAMSETGVLEFIQLKASDAQEAARAAIWVTGALACIEVQRLEDLS